MILSLSLVELATLLDATIDATEKIPSLKNIKINALRSLEQAKEDDLAFILNPSEEQLFTPLSTEIIEKSKASWIVASKKITQNKHFLLVADPLEALEKLQQFLNKKQNIASEKYRSEWPHAFVSTAAKIDSTVQIEPGVIIKAGVCIGAHSKIKAHAYIDYNVQIGSFCTIGTHVMIHDHSIIKNHVSIDAHATIGSDGYGYQATKTGIKKIPHLGNVIINDHVEIGASTTIDRAVFDETLIGAYTKIDNQVYIAHNVKIGSYTFILTQVAIGGSTQIGSFCKIGAQTGIKDHLIIGDYVQIVGKSGITQNVPAHSIIAGFPAQPLLEWKKQSIALTKLPHFFKKVSSSTKETKP